MVLWALVQHILLVVLTGNYLPNMEVHLWCTYCLCLTLTRIWCQIYLARNRFSFTVIFETWFITVLAVLNEFILYLSYQDEFIYFPLHTLFFIKMNKSEKSYKENSAHGFLEKFWVPCSIPQKRNFQIVGFICTLSIKNCNRYI